jgi:mRNA-degrading endonuclease RelE of RelBE toxin-antitoxin system
VTHLFTSGYAKLLRRLPNQIKRRAVKTLELLDADESHPSLHFKEVARHASGWSVRVSGDYRMVGYREGDVMTWFWIGKHDAYDLLLRRLV